MKRTLIFIFFIVLSQMIIAQQKKVAVYVSGEATGVSKILGDRLVDAFTSSGRYVAIERTSSFLAELSKEQSYQRTGAVSDMQISRLGEQFGVDFVCVADVSEAFGEKYVSARLIDVETAEVVNSANASSPMTSMDELMEVTSEIATVLTGKTPKEIAEEEAAYEAERKRIRAEEEKAKAEFEAKCASKQAELKKQLAQGYIQVGDYYVTFPANASYFEWDDAISYKNNFPGWRFPSVQEHKQILETLSNMISASQNGSNYEKKIYKDIKSSLERYYNYVSGIARIERFSDGNVRHCTEVLLNDRWCYSGQGGKYHKDYCRGGILMLIKE